MYGLSIWRRFRIKLNSKVRGTVFLNYCFLGLTGLVCVGGILNVTNVCAQSLEFQNFSQDVEVDVSDDRLMSIEGGELYGQLSNRLIVKTHSMTDKYSLKNLAEDVCNCRIQVSALYASPRFNYFVISVPLEVVSTAVIKELSEKSEVLLVQPDVLLIRSRSGQNELNGNIQREPSPLSSIIPLWYVRGIGQEGNTREVRIAIIDDGFDFTHEDLSHVDVAFAYDVERQSFDVMPNWPVDGHGQRVAGVILGAHNNQGPDGIIPDARLIAIRQTKQWTSHTLLALSVAARAGAEIINCSWHSESLMQPVADIVNDLAKWGRAGRGLPIVFAAGNKGKVISINEHEAAIRSAIVVGALDQSFQIAVFSNRGPSVDVYFPGSKLLSTNVNNKYGKYSGTSFSAALATGYIALLIASNYEISLAEINNKLSLLAWKK